jgi:flagellar transcriptional activator FlhD
VLFFTLTSSHGNRSATHQEKGKNMTINQRTLSEIREVNLSYLILAQSMLREDRVQAMFQLGIAERVADLLIALTPAQIVKIASGNVLLCCMRCDDEFVWSLLSEQPRMTEFGEVNAGRLHANILLAGRAAEAIQP